MQARHLPFCLLFLLFIGDCAAALAFDPQALLYEKSIEGKFIGKSLYLTAFDNRQTKLEDAWLQIQQGNFFQVDQERVNFGISDRIYFGYFEIRNPQTYTQELILENNFGMADYFHLFQMNESGRFDEIFAGGDQVDITQRHIIARTMNARLLLKPGINRFMVKAYGDTCLQIPLRLWREAGYRDQMFKEYLALGLLVGIHLVMILYNAFLGLALKDKVYFYYIIFVFSNVVYHVSNFNLGQYLGWILFDSRVYSNHIQLVAVDSIIIFAIFFSKRFLNFSKIENPVLNMILTLNVGLSIFNIVINNQLSVFVSSTFTLISASIGVTILPFIGFIKLRARFHPAQFYLLAWMAYLLGSGGIIAVNLGLLEATDYNYWAQFVGGAIEVSLFSLALASRINFIKKKNHQHIKSLNHELQSLNSNLENKVEERTTEIREILKHLHQGIFTITSNKTIESEYSKFLETIFIDRNLSGKNIISLLRKQSTLSNDDLDRLSSAIDFSINEDEAGFLMNKDCFPESLTLRCKAGTEKFLQLEWVAIKKEGITQKILVSVRDITEKRHLESQISEKSNELSYIFQLIEIKAERFNQFTKVSSEFMQEIHEVLSSQILDQSLIRNLLINYHSLKGLTRTMGLNDLSNAIHDAESELVQNKIDVDQLSLNQYRASFERIKSIFDRYMKINNEKLGRFIDPNFNWVPKALIHNLIHNIEESENPGPKISRDVSALKSFYYKSIEDIVFGHMNVMKSICTQLGKPMPSIKFLDSHYGLAPSAMEAFDLAITQLIRNSLDHGIEQAARRLANGKTERGFIEFRMIECAEHLEIRIADDGQGLMLSRIKEVAVSRGNLDASCDDFLKIAQQIFEPSISTRLEVSNISGRGIGLDAAKTSLLQVGGNLGIQLLDTPTFQSACRFEFIVSLPKNQYCRFEADSKDSPHIAA